MLFSSGEANVATDHLLDFLKVYAPMASERAPMAVMGAGASHASVMETVGASAATSAANGSAESGNGAGHDGDEGSGYGTGLVLLAHTVEYFSHPGVRAESFPAQVRLARIFGRYR